RNRFLRHRETLFTFLEHDGVPWNNSNAEHAIRRFAHYGAATVALCNEAGLSHYLMLLSIQQTCKCRGLSFLSFLLSGETEIDAYAEPSRITKRLDTPETYPDWFIDARKKRHTTAETAAVEIAQGDNEIAGKKNIN